MIINFVSESIIKSAKAIKWDTIQPEYSILLIQLNWILVQTLQKNLMLAITQSN